MFEERAAWRVGLWAWIASSWGACRPGITLVAFALCLAAMCRVGSPWASAMAQTPPTSSESSAAAARPDPTDLSPDLRAALARVGDSERGRESFAACAVCHLDDGRGRADGSIPQLAGQHATVIVKQLIDIREGRRVNPVMLPFARRLSGAQEVADVAAYVSQLSRSPANSRGTGHHLALGSEIYARDCAVCHGARGEGDAAHFVPALAGQHYGYLLRQIRDIGAGRRGNAHPVMVALVEGFSDAELRALCDYASRMRDVETSR